MVILIGSIVVVCLTVNATAFLFLNLAAPRENSSAACPAGTAGQLKRRATTADFRNAAIPDIVPMPAICRSPTG